MQATALHGASELLYSVYTVVILVYQAATDAGKSQTTSYTDIQGQRYRSASDITRTYSAEEVHHSTINIAGPI